MMAPMNRALGSPKSSANPMKTVAQAPRREREDHPARGDGKAWTSIAEEQLGVGLKACHEEQDNGGDLAQRPELDRYRDNAPFAVAVGKGEQGTKMGS